MLPGFFVYNLCKNPEESLIMIIDVISLFWLFRVCSFYIESKARLRGDIISIYHDISHIFHNNSTFHLGTGKKSVASGPLIKLIRYFGGFAPHIDGYFTTLPNLLTGGILRIFFEKWAKSILFLLPHFRFLGNFSTPTLLLDPP